MQSWFVLLQLPCHRSILPFCRAAASRRAQPRSYLRRTGYRDTENERERRRLRRSAEMHIYISTGNNRREKAEEKDFSSHLSREETETTVVTADILRASASRHSLIGRLSSPQTIPSADALASVSRSHKASHYAPACVTSDRAPMSRELIVTVIADHSHTHTCTARRAAFVVSLVTEDR